MKVLQLHKSSFERQIDEAVKIQLNRQFNILNSKSEYKRSLIPRLGVKIGHKVFKSKKEYDDDEQKDEGGKNDFGKDKADEKANGEEQPKEEV